jgi:ABC-type phosphate transport system auxiliary subunit
MEEITSPDFLNVYLETIWADIEGKNKEIILLKAKNKIFHDDNKNITEQLERTRAELKNNLFDRDAFSNDLNEARSRVGELESKLKMVSEELVGVKRNYSLVMADAEKARAENLTLQKTILDMKPVENESWEEGSLVKESKRKKK